MADQTEQRPKTRRKLPPLAQNGDDPSDIVLPKRRSKTSNAKKSAEHAAYSDTEEQNNEATDSNKKPTPRKKKKKPVGNSRETLMSEGEALGDRGEQPAKKKKRKRKASQMPTYAGDNLGLAAELADMEEDVVVDDDDQIESRWTAVPAMKSEPLNKVFVEKQNRFKSKDKVQLEHKRAVQEEFRRAASDEKTSYHDTKYYALTSHRGFRTFCVFVEGLFGGFALWHVTQSWLLTKQSIADFLEFYSDLALPVSCIYYLVFVIVTVGVLDRYDIGSPSKRLFWRCCTCQSVAIVILIYFTGLILTTATTHLDDKISLYNTSIDREEGLWNDRDEARDDVETWRLLNLFRGLMAMLGWLVVSLRPQTDRLSKTLYAQDDNLFGDVPQRVAGDVEDGGQTKY